MSRFLKMRCKSLSACLLDGSAWVWALIKSWWGETPKLVLGEGEILKFDRSQISILRILRSRPGCIFLSGSAIQMLRACQCVCFRVFLPTFNLQSFPSSKFWFLNFKSQISDLDFESRWVAGVAYQCDMVLPITYSFVFLCIRPYPTSLTHR